MSKLLSFARTPLFKANLVVKSHGYEVNNFRSLVPSSAFNIPKRNNSYKNFRNPTPLYYCTAAGVFILGCSYAAVPLYRIFCQATGYAGTTKTHSGGSLENVKKRPERLLTIKFSADTNSTMSWNFKPQQRELQVIPGETALAFYTAENPTDEPVVGISTYNVIPFEAGQYFNKIQCFCFEEQMLNPHEEVNFTNLRRRSILKNIRESFIVTAEDDYK